MERKLYIWLAVLDFFLLFCTIALFTFMMGRKEDCYASKSVDVPMNKEDVEDLGVKAVNVTQRFRIMFGVFLVNFAFTSSVSISKIFVKFNT